MLRAERRLSGRNRETRTRNVHVGGGCHSMLSMRGRGLFISRSPEPTESIERGSTITTTPEPNAVCVPELKRSRLRYSAVPQTLSKRLPAEREAHRDWVLRRRYRVVAVK